MSNLKQQLIRIGHQEPSLRPHIRAVLSADMSKAETKFIERKHLIEQELDKLGKAVDRFGDRDNKIQWRHANSLGHVLDKLIELNRFIK